MKTIQHIQAKLSWGMVLREAWDYAQLTVGAVMIAAGLNAFLAPNHVVSGGVSGIAMMIHFAFGLPIGAVLLCLNIPLLILLMRYAGGLRLGIRTVYATAVMSVAIDLLAPYIPPVTADPLLYTIFGGLLDGLGMGLVFRARGTTGGTDIVAKLVNRFWGIQLGQVILWVNTGVLLSAALLVGLQPALYALIVTFIASRVVDAVQEGAVYSRAAIIVSRKTDAIRQAVFDELERGVTILEGRGGYTDTEQQVLYVVVAVSEIAVLKRLLGTIDPQAFVVISDAHEVLGYGFKAMTA
ncbi:MAG: YitT family protein [Thermoflexales bacterium]|nr:YitT family protein [Thermoflexales bacterium]